MNESVRAIVISALAAAVGSALTFMLAGPFLVEKRLTKIELEVQGLGTRLDHIESRLDGQIDRLKQNYDTIDSRVSVLQNRHWTADDSAKLLDELDKSQRKFVRESWGTEIGQCFSDDDYKAFVNSKSVDAAVDGFAEAEAVKQLLPKIRSLSADEWSGVLAMIRKHFHKSWTENGTIDRTGQSDAGQRAEKDIANAVGQFLDKQRAR